MMEKVKVLGIVIALAVMAIQFNLVGCSKPEEPAKAQFTKAIVEHALATNCRIMVQTIVIVEKGARKEDGSWPYKVRYACMELPSGDKKGIVERGRTEREETVEIYKTVDSKGQHVWAVRP